MSPLVMIVDDTESARKPLVRLFQRAGVNAIGAAGVEEGLTLLTRHRPNVIVLDLTMPGIDGYQMLRDVRTDPRWRRLPVVVYSALSDPKSITRAMDLGATDYIVKASLPPRDLIDRVTGHLPNDPGGLR